MARDMEPRYFVSSEASEMARRVVDRDASESPAEAFVPKNEGAASAGVEALSQQLEKLPHSIRGSLERAERGAAHLSDDRLQGLSELIQNADDLQARTVRIAIDPVQSRLLFEHDGLGVSLSDVWALAIPWLSVKVGNPELTGRFGIGLKTLQTLSRILEVHHGFFHVRLEPQKISVMADSAPSLGQEEGTTVFAVPFEPGAVDIDDVAGWLSAWGDQGLLFLRHVRTALVLDGERLVARLRVERHLNTEPGRKTHGDVEDVRSSDGRVWTLFSRLVTVTSSVQRADKATGETTPIAIAVPRFPGDHGYVHAGLPVRPIGLPFRVHGHFDPSANRRDLSDTGWNGFLFEALADLWRDIALNQFERDPVAGWAAVPLTAELEVGPRLAEGLSAVVSAQLFNRARREFAERLTLGHEGLGLADLAYEVPELTNILTPADAASVAGSTGGIGPDLRSTGDRWRLVLADLAGIGAACPTLVDISRALPLLSDLKRPAGFVATLLAVAIDAGFDHHVENQPCVVLESGRRATPMAFTHAETLLPRTAGPLWEILGMGARLHPEYRDGRDVVMGWLTGRGLLLRAADDQEALKALSKLGQEDGRLPEPLTDDQANALREALEGVASDTQDRLGRGIGALRG